MFQHLPEVGLGIYQVNGGLFEAMAFFPANISCMFASVMRRYAEKQPDGRIKQFEQMLAKLLGCGQEQALEALCSLMDCVLVRKPMRAYGVTEAELPHYADTVIETQQRLLRNNYVSLERDEILTIYKSAF